MCLSHNQQADTNTIEYIDECVEGLVLSRVIRGLLAGFVVLSVASCGNSGLFKNSTGKKIVVDNRAPEDKALGTGKFSDLFGNKNNPNVTLRVNRYIWDASLAVLDFLPIEGEDPFSGVIVTGWGRAPGSSRQYRATIYVQDPALDARSLRVALIGRSGPVSKDTVRKIENAILTRARQLRIADSKL